MRTWEIFERPFLTHSRRSRPAWCACAAATRGSTPSESVSAPWARACALRHLEHAHTRGPRAWLRAVVVVPRLAGLPLPWPQTRRPRACRGAARAPARRASRSTRAWPRRPATAPGTAASCRRVVHQAGFRAAIGVQRQRVPARAGAQIALEVRAMPAQLPACIRGALRGRIRAQRATVATVAANAWSRARALVEARRSRRRGFEAPPDFFLFFIFIS